MHEKSNISQPIRLDYLLQPRIALRDDGAVFERVPLLSRQYKIQFLQRTGLHVSRNLPERNERFCKFLQQF